MSWSRAINDEIEPLAAKRFWLPSECMHCTNKWKVGRRTGPDSKNADTPHKEPAA